MSGLYSQFAMAPFTGTRMCVKMPRQEFGKLEAWLLNSCFRSGVQNSALRELDAKKMMIKSSTS